MSRMIPLDGAYKVEVVGNLSGKRTYRKDRRGAIEVESRSDQKALIAEGLAFPAAVAGPSAHLPGFQCVDCGRRNYFKTCGNCGSVEGMKDGR